MNDSWESYHEPLARIFREVKKALPECKEDIHTMYMTENMTDDEVFERVSGEVAFTDVEVRDEIKNLIRQMILEIEDD